MNLPYTDTANKALSIAQEIAGEVTARHRHEMTRELGQKLNELGAA